MSHLLLHTGAHKTGTTTIQHTLGKNRDLLAAAGVIYPFVGPNQGHHALTAIWAGELPRLPADFFARKSPEDMLQEIVAAHAGSDRRVILSSEAFTQRGRRQVDMADLRRRLAPFDTVRLLHVVRQQPAFLQSMYLQVARNAEVRPWREFLMLAVGRHRALGLWAEMNALYDHFLTGFAPGEIRFADYDRARGAEGGLVGLVLHHAGAVPGLGSRLAPLDENRNVSPEPLALWLARETAGGKAPAPGVLRIAGETLRAHFGADMRSTLYRRAELAEVVAHFTPLNARFEARVQRVQPDLRLTPCGMPDDLVYRDDLSADVMRAFRASLEGRRQVFQAAAAGTGAKDAAARRAARRKARRAAQQRAAQLAGRGGGGRHG